MSTQTITAPVILDSTGQSILTALGQIKEAVQPTNSCLDIDISLPTTGWSGEGPYTYTYSNTHITSGCAVKVNFLESASSGGVLCLDYEKVTGGVQFTSDSVPTATIPVRIHVLNADATSTTATTADAVSTDAVSGASNVQDALTTLNTQIGTGYDTNANGSYWKFPDGTLICAKTVSQVVTWSAWGTLYESSVMSFGSWAYAFKTGTVPFVITTPKNSPAAAMTAGAGSVTATDAGSGRFIRPNNPGETQMSLDLIAIGRWK